MRPRFYRRSLLPRRKARWQWVRETVNDASPNATLNSIDLLANFKTHAGITINLPEFVIWRIRLKISIIISQAADVAANDGVLTTVFVDGANQVKLSQLLNAYDQEDMLYDMRYTSEYAFLTADTGPHSVIPLYKEYDIKVHRRLKSLDDTLFLQLAASGQANITGYSYSAAILCKTN